MPIPRRTMQLAAATLLLLTWGTPRPLAAEERPAFTANLLDQAWEQLESKRYGKAAEAARQVVALGGPPAAVAQGWNLLGVALYQQWSVGLEDASDEALKRLRRRGLRDQRLEASTAHELLKEAAQAFRRAVELQPDAANPVRLNLAQVLYYLRRDGHAADVIAEYVRRGGNDSEALALQACLDSVKGSAPPHYVFGDVSRPEKISGANPEYTDIARQVNAKGTVILEIVVDEEGKVLCIRVLEPLPVGLTEQAVNALRAWRFKPATLQGQPVKVYYTITINFAIYHSRG